jgi:hypothetical protein
MRDLTLVLELSAVGTGQSMPYFIRDEKARPPTTGHEHYFTLYLHIFRP